jgi:hypothetical protein
MFFMAENLDKSIFSENSLIKNNQETPKKTFFERVRSFLPSFRKNEPDSQKRLVGRIHIEVHLDAHKTLEELKKMKEWMQTELVGGDAGELWTSIEAVINPMIREFTQLDRKVSNIRNEDEKNQAIQVVTDWVEKAKGWVALCSKPHDREDIINAVVAHTMEMTKKVIERDVKTLFDYREHELSALELDIKGIQELELLLDEALLPYIGGLISLEQIKPESLQLQALSNWKAEIDMARNRYFNQALHAMDNVIKKYAPFAPVIEEQEHLKEIINQLDFLEHEISVFMHRMEVCDLQNPTQRKALKVALDFFHEQIDALYADMRLTPELAERLQEIAQELEKTKNWFENAL